jgi:hypothetical protein
VTTNGFSVKGLSRVRDVLTRHVDAGLVPGAIAVVARHGQVHVEAAGTLAFLGEGSSTPMAGDTICRLASMTKPLVAACAMTLVEDNTLRLDDPIDDFIPELSNMTVLVDPNGSLDNTVPALRAITLRDLLAFCLGAARRWYLSRGARTFARVGLAHDERPFDADATDTRVGTTRGGHQLGFLHVGANRTSEPGTFGRELRMEWLWQRVVQRPG